MGKRGALAPPPLRKCCEVFCAFSNYSKTLSRRIIYALFSQSVVGFWGLCSHPHQRLHSLTPLGDFCPQTLKLSIPEKNFAGAHDYVMLFAGLPEKVGSGNQCGIERRQY